MEKNKINSIKHKDNRAHIPSKEEAGYETANDKVRDGKATLELPKNPVIHRGQDPELFWLNKYGNDDRDDLLKIDIRSLYRHEHIAPEQIIKGLYKVVEEKKNPDQMDLFSNVNELFGNALERDELEKVSEYYQHSDGWTNRLIQGDSHLVMASLLEREGMAGQVQTIYFDPPYGIKYNSNWQLKINTLNVKDGKDEDISGEPEQVKAFRDTWELGIHSYLSYLRDRLLIAKELLNESGSCFVQISDENVHLVRAILDEVFGSENFVSEITVKKTTPLGSRLLPRENDYVIWYAKDESQVKYRQLYIPKDPISSGFTRLLLSDGTIRPLTKQEKSDYKRVPSDAEFITTGDLTKPGPGSKYEIEYNGKIYNSGNRWWGSPKKSLEKLIKKNRIVAAGKNIYFLRKFSDFPYTAISNVWTDTAGLPNKMYVVQTNEKIAQRCLLMATDPGDLVLDPTCGSGTTASVAEKWGRRWITIDTSRIAINIAKQRLMTQDYPYFLPYDKTSFDIRQGFDYIKYQRVSQSTVANEEDNFVNIYDKPIDDKSKLRVSGPFTVETLQNFEPVSPASLDNITTKTEDDSSFEGRIFEHLKSAGVKNGIKNEQAVFIRVETLADSFLHAEGFYLNNEGQECKAYFHIGPKFGTVAKKAVNEAIKSCRTRGDADWLIILGFSFESDIANQNVTMSVGSFEVTKVRMHDDLMQEGLLKKDKKAASFVTIGEPDIKLHKEGNQAHVEIRGLDIYDPIKDEVKARNVEDIAYWMVDDDYDGSNFVVKQVFFCGGKKDEFKKWRKGLDNLAKQKTKRNVERTLKIEIDDEAFDRLYGFESHPFEVKKGQKVAVRVISQFGEESTKILHC